jgi:6-pyruvoyltetrahydropterin/6-carboxytetrahydropterin synthase
MPWTLSKRFTFEAAHHLPEHDGKCRRPHGHSWGLEVEVQGDTVHTQGPKSGMLVDYGDIRAAVQPLLETVLDHQDLNYSTGLDSPTSERLAAWLFARLAHAVPGLSAITIHETATSACRYTP